MKRRRIIITLVFIGAILALFFFVRSLLPEQKIRVTIAGSFNPTTDTAWLNQEKMKVIATDPFILEAKSSKNTSEVQVRGPYLAPFNNKDVKSGQTIETTSRSIDEVAQQFVKPPQKITSITQFEKNWTLIRSTNENDSTKVFTVISYGDYGDDWVLLAEDPKINTSFISNAPSTLINYLDMLAGD